MGLPIGVMNRGVRDFGVKAFGVFNVIWSPPPVVVVAVGAGISSGGTLAADAARDIDAGGSSVGGVGGCGVIGAVVISLPPVSDILFQELTC